MNSNISSGYLYIYLWCIISAVAQLFTSNIEQTLDPGLVAFSTFSLSSLFFIVVNRKRLPILIKKIRERWQEVTLVNITTVGCWLLLLYPLKYLEPAIVVAIFLGVRPITTLLLGKLFYKTQYISRLDIALSIILTLFVVYLGSVTLLDKSAVIQTVSLNQQFLALLACVLGGSTLSLNAIYSKRLSNIGFTPVDILSIRFILLVIVSIFLVHPWHATLPVITEHWLSLALIALTLIIIPQYVYQVALRQLPPISLAINSPLMPVLLFALEYFDQRLHPTAWTILGVAAITLLTALYGYLRYRIDNQHKTKPKAPTA